MMIFAILKQARQYYDYVVPQFCHAQFYTVENGALIPAGNCMVESAFWARLMPKGQYKCQPELLADIGLDFDVKGT